MLTIRFGTQDEFLSTDKNYVKFPDARFNVEYNPEWMDDELVKDMVLDVDKTTVIKGSYLESPVLGPISPKQLSGGTKALILMYKMPQLFIRGGACGNNCSKWILEIAKRQDIRISLGYPMHFEGEFTATIENSNTVVHNMEEFLREWFRYKANRKPVS